MKNLLCSLILLTLLVCVQSGFAASFTAGNVVVYRVGDGVAGLVNTGVKVFLDEFATNGALVQSIELPSAAGDANQLVANGTSTSEGLLTRSTDGKLLLLTGYRPNPFPYGSNISGASGSAVNRVVGKVTSSGTLQTMALADFASASSPRSATSTDGSAVWITGGAGSVRYATWGDGASGIVISNALVNLRQVNIFNGQLYVTTQSTGGGNTIPLGAIGSGLPTTNQVLVALPGLPVLTGSGMYGFYFCDLSGSEPGDDTLYIADDTVDYISKYCKVSGTWTQYGTLAAVDYRGLVGSVNGTEVTLYTTTGSSAAAGGGTLATVTDASGYQGTLSGTLTTLATASANTAFRGVALAPIPEPMLLGIISLTVLALLRRR